VVYAFSVLFSILVMVGVVEDVLLSTRGVDFWGGPTLVATTRHDGRDIYIYEDGGLWCGYSVYAAEPHAMFSRRVLHEAPAKCAKGLHVEFRENGAATLLDENNEPVHSKPLFDGLFGC
jgi:hypothetical protein